MTEEQKAKGREANKRWRENNRDYDKLRQKEYWSANPEKRQAKFKRWYYKDQEKSINIMNEAYHRNKGNDRPSNKNTYKMWWGARKRATQNNILFDIEIEDIIIPDNCPCCDSKMIKSTQTAPSLDKVNPSLGYTKSNIAVICKSCNTVKSFGSAELHRKIANFIDTHTSTLPIPHEPND